jgi:hypothetical protein
MSQKPHSTHETIGDILERSLPLNYTLIKDVACGGRQRIPLFCTAEKSRETEYCNVDLLVLKGGEIKMIVEIEESDVKPTQICGKFLTSALAKYYIHDSSGNKPVEMGNTVTFIQIVDTSNLVKDRTSKFKQWKLLEKSINGILPLENSRIASYKLMNADNLNELASFMKKGAYSSQ